MRLVVKKLEVIDLGQLQSLVIEHLDGIEPGLTVLDSRLLLGHATIDIVALDAEGALVLTTVGFTADEEMLLKAVEAYSWCLEYPDAIRRLYPSVEISAARPPRLMFVVERLPDAFHRKIKQLGFSEVDCVEFRYLDVSGAPTAYFDTIARLRRGPGLAEFTPAPIARRVAELPIRRAPEPIAAERSVEKIVDRTDKVVPLSAPSTARATSVRLQKLLNTNGSNNGNGAAPVIEIAARAAAASTPRVETPRVETPAARIETSAPRIEAPHVEIAAAAVETPAARIEVPHVEIAAAAVETPAARIETPRIETPAPRIEVPAPRIETPAPRIEVPAPRIETPAPRLELVEAPAPRVEAPAPKAAPRIEAPAAVIEPIARVTLREAVAALAPVVVAAPAPAPIRAPQPPEPRVSFAEIAKELLGTPAPAPRLAPPAVIPRPPVEEITRAALEDIAAAAAGAIAETESAIAVEDVPGDLELEAAVAALVREPVTAPVAKPVVETKPAPVVAAAPAPVVAAPAPAPAPAPAAKPVVATKPVARPTTPEPETAPAAAAPNLPQEFEGLKFPNDGVLTRQWMEFLNQMAATK